jgi:hypothetical protein
MAEPLSYPVSTGPMTRMRGLGRIQCQIADTHDPRKNSCSRKRWCGEGKVTGGRGDEQGNPQLKECPPTPSPPPQVGAIFHPESQAIWPVSYPQVGGGSQTPPREGFRAFGTGGTFMAASLTPYSPFPCQGKGGGRGDWSPTLVIFSWQGATL